MEDKYGFSFVFKIIQILTMQFNFSQPLFLSCILCGFILNLFLILCGFLCVLCDLCG